MNESPHVTYQIDYTLLDMIVRDPSLTEDQTARNTSRPYLIVCYKPRSRIVVKTFFSTSKPDRHTIQTPLSTSTLTSESEAEVKP